MKKHFLFVLTLVLAACSLNAQTTIYSQTFAGGLGSWTSVDNVSSGFKWTYTHNSISTPDFGTFGFKSPTAVNGFAAIVADGSGTVAVSTALKSPAINCTGHNYVGLQVTEWLKIYQQATATISVSNDGTTWTQVLDAAYYSDETNAEVQELDISSVAANQATVYIKFDYAATNDFFWAVDDIKLLDLPPADVKVVSIDGEDYSPLNASYMVNATVQNRGGTALNSFTLTYDLSGTSVTSETFTGFNLQPFATQTIQFTSSTSIDAIYAYNLEVVSSLPNGTADGYVLNDSAFKKVIGLSHVPAKNVLLEEFTTVNCGWCPGGATTIEKLMETEGSYVIPVAVHSGFGTDIMTVNEDNTLANAFCEGAPEANIDRVKAAHSDYVAIGLPSLQYINQYPEWKNAAIARHSYLPPVSVSASNTYDSINRQVTATVNATFYGPVSGNFRVNCYVVEDSIANSNSNYSQHSYYYGSPTDTSLNPWYHVGTNQGSGTSIMPGYVHNHVIRKFLGTAWGSTGVIPSTTTDTTTYTKIYSYSLPAGLRDNKISLVAFVNEYNTDYSSTKNSILNCVSMRLNGSAQNEAPAAVTTGIAETPSAIDQMALYPNPTNGKEYIKYSVTNDSRLGFEVYNVMGQLVYTVAEANISKGNATTVINSEKFESGVYFVAVKDNGRLTQTLKFIVAK